MLNNLKILTFSYIAEHDRLTKDEKLQLGEFVKEANKDQVLNLLITGYPQSKSISEKFVKENEELVSELIEPAFKLLRVGDHFVAHFTSGDVVAVGGIVLAAALTAAAAGLYANYIDKFGKKCRDFAGFSDGQSWCLHKVRADAYNKQIKTLSSSVKECKKTKNPTKCVSKIKEKIIKLTKKMKNNREKEKHFKSRMDKRVAGDKNA
jgi:gas vesicle protein